MQKFIDVIFFKFGIIWKQSNKTYKFQENTCMLVEETHCQTMLGSTRTQEDLIYLSKLGSSLSAVIAEIFMEIFKEGARS